MMKLLKHIPPSTQQHQSWRQWNSDSVRIEGDCCTASCSRSTFNICKTLWLPKLVRQNWHYLQVSKIENVAELPLGRMHNQPGSSAPVQRFCSKNHFRQDSVEKATRQMQSKYMNIDTIMDSHRLYQVLFHYKPSMEYIIGLIYMGRGIKGRSSQIIDSNMISNQQMP